MLRPPRLPFILLAVSCLFFLTRSAAAQPSWDLAEDENGNSAGGSVSASQAVDSEAPPDVPQVAPRPAPAPGPAWSGGGDDEAELDQRLEVMGEKLKSAQRAWRSYSAGWIMLQAGLIGYSSYMAATSDGAVKASSIARVVVSGLNFLRLVGFPQPARSGYKKFKKLPEGTLSEKQLKYDEGLRILGAQLGQDRLATAPAQHVLAALVALSVGAGVLFSYDDGMRPAVETTLGIMVIAELQFATRPHRVRRYMLELSGAGRNARPPVEVSFAPVVTPTSRGLGVVGRF
jgi:hypothetical protein